MGFRAKKQEGVEVSTGSYIVCPQVAIGSLASVAARVEHFLLLYIYNGFSLQKPGDVLLLVIAVNKSTELTKNNNELMSGQSQTHAMPSLSKTISNYLNEA